MSAKEVAMVLVVKSLATMVTALLIVTSTIVLKFLGVILTQVFPLEKRKY